MFVFKLVYSDHLLDWTHVLTTYLDLQNSLHITYFSQCLKKTEKTLSLYELVNNIQLIHYNLLYKFCIGAKYKTFCSLIFSNTKVPTSVILL